MTWFLIALGGLVGAPSRYLLDRAISGRAGHTLLPWGTITVNVIGSALLGVLVGLLGHTKADTLLLALIGTGFCGAFTTFSTFTWETLALAEDKELLAAAGNVVLSLTLGLAVAAAAFLLA